LILGSAESGARNAELMRADQRPTLMVSSTVRGVEPLLDQVYGVLHGYGYDVWMSYKGTIPTHSRETPLESSLKAVENCEAFLGIITGSYGSVRERDERSITHEEFLHAVRCDKLRWFLVHRDVEIAHRLLKPYRYRKDGTPKLFPFKKTDVLEDLRVLEMYDCAIGDRKWAQPFSGHADVLRFIEAQFARPERMKTLLSQGFGPQ